MRRRISVAGAALSAGFLAFGAVGATAANTGPLIKITCKTSLGIVVAQGNTDVVPVVKQGAEYGTAKCGKLLGSGVQSDTFTVPDSGDTRAQYRMYFPTGTIQGKYHLIPQQGTFGNDNFSETDYLGVLTVTGGTGTFQGSKGTGTMKCKTLDGIHTTCTEKLKLLKP